MQQGGIRRTATYCSRRLEAGSLPTYAVRLPTTIGGTTTVKTDIVGRWRRNFSSSARKGVEERIFDRKAPLGGGAR